MLVNGTDGAEAHPAGKYLILFNIYKMLIPSKVVRLLFLSSILFNTAQLEAQDYNAFVSTPVINPSPLPTVQQNGIGEFSFLTGNTGSQPMNDRLVEIIIRLSNGVPSTTDPLNALGGSAANYFTWTYNDSNASFRGEQNNIIPARSSGNITISYRVTQNSPSTDPANGFSVTINPRSYENITGDDEISLYTYTQCIQPDAPVVGNITNPTCATPTGSVQLSGLPQGSWTIDRSPGTFNLPGTGSTVTITGLSPGTYTFAVTNSEGCTSDRSTQVVIEDAPSAPARPMIGTITNPTCALSTGSVQLTGLPQGTWTVNRDPGTFNLSGTGTSVVISGISPGTYTFTVTNSEGCTSASSAPVVIENAPSAPPRPVESVNCFGSGFAVVTVQSPLGTGYQYRLDNGSFSNIPTFFNVPNGTHTITVRNQDGCITTGNAFTFSCGCINNPSLTLSSTSALTCAGTAITINGNSFGGSATMVSISENGAGSLSATSITSSPFSFTYTPAASDAGEEVIITFRTDNPSGEPCEPATATFTLRVNPIPSAPVIQSLEQPSCNSTTGRVSLSGLPGQGTWNVIRTPGNVTYSGSGTTTVISGLESGTYTFQVSALGCTSPASATAVINQPPEIPGTPVAGTIVHPDCDTPLGTLTLTGLPSGSWTLIMYPGTVSITGSGATTTINNLAPGTYNFTVRSTSGCTSALSSNIRINQQPQTPTVPVPGSITAPTCARPMGSVVLSGLPATGNWEIRSVSGGLTFTGRGSSATIQNLPPGSYSFNVTNSSGCTSGNTSTIVIPQIPNAPVLVIHNPPEVCSPATIDLTASSITAGSTPNLTLSYWRNPAGTIPLNNPSQATTGVYYIRGTNSAQCSDVKPVNVTVLQRPVANAQSDLELDYVFSADISANSPGTGETGNWSIITGTGVLSDPYSPMSSVSNLNLGENILLWTVSNAACPSSSDTLSIIVRDLVVPTLITPNEDGRNDYLFLRGIESFQNNELYIFDRRGALVYKTTEYRNDWNGIDYNGDPVTEGTYFYVLKSGNGRQKSGYIVIRR